MTQEGFKRKLTIIFSADAVDYSRLMGDDEAATVRTLTSYRNVIPTLIKHTMDHDDTIPKKSISGKMDFGLRLSKERR